MKTFKMPCDGCSSVNDLRGRSSRPGCGRLRWTWRWRGRNLHRWRRWRSRAAERAAGSETARGTSPSSSESPKPERHEDRAELKPAAANCNRVHLLSYRPEVRVTCSSLLTELLLLLHLSSPLFTSQVSFVLSPSVFYSAVLKQLKPWNSSGSE